MSHRSFKTGMVAAPQPEAAEAGIEVMRGGGNAVDAAIAAALVQTVVDPLMCGIAGFGSAAIFMPERQVHEYVDFHAPAPAAARPDMWEHLVEGEARDGFGFVLRGRVNDLGYQSVCVPAALRAFDEIHTAYGRLPWRDLCRPAIDWAMLGWMVRPAVERFWFDEGEMGRTPNRDRLRFSDSGRRMFCRPDGTPKRTGDTVENRDYASLLSRIAEEGAAAFYEGEIAGQISEDFARHGALLTGADLEAYRPKRTSPLVGTYRGHRIATNQPPGGGVMLLEMLNILERFELRGLGHNTPQYIRVVAEAMKRATVDKDRFVGDPDFTDVPLDRITSKEYGAELATEIRSGVRAEVARLNASSAPPRDTTHLSVVDPHGNCVSMTHSLGMPSGVITHGLGFMYNGCMAVFDPRPGRAGSIAPGKARFSAMCPTMVFKGDKPYIVIGAPGGTQIVMGVLQAILNVIDFEMRMQEAVFAPRFSSTSNAIDVSNRIPRFVTRELEAQGYPIVRNPYSYTIGYVHGIRCVGDVLEGGADPARDGIALAS
jgi:gamma-glutamyltranspeptidase / glutathione hydrolase